ncbi:hypothetical protein [Fodinibius saliphilus]|uniref:hypothetical protein n=1 Tax=Fodinibius saliphilus TaxID=1920650 RepID=UPI001109C13A|nr:hypothetical protein [Fodinibius saliphilus]
MDYVFETEEYLSDLIYDPDKIASSAESKMLSSELADLKSDAQEKLKEYAEELGFQKVEFLREEFWNDPDFGDREINYILKNNLLITEYTNLINHEIAEGSNHDSIHDKLVEWYFETLKIKCHDLIDISGLFESFRKEHKGNNQDSLKDEVDSKLAVYSRKYLIQEVGYKVKLCERLYHSLPNETTVLRIIFELDYIFFRNERDYDLDLLEELYRKRYEALRYHNLEKPIVGTKTNEEPEIIVIKCQEAFDKGIGYTKNGKIVIKQLAEYLRENTRYASTRGAAKALKIKFLKAWYLLGNPELIRYDIVFKGGSYYMIEKMN